MNFLLVTGNKDAEKSAGARSCLYCKRVFNSPQALGGHLRAHQEEMKSGGIWNHVGSSNSVDITRTNPYPFLNSQPQYGSRSSIMATGFPSDHSLSVGRNEVCQYNTDKIRTCPDALRFPFRGALPNFQGHGFNKLPYPTSAMIIPYPTLGLNQSPGIKEPTTTGSHSFWSGSHPCSGDSEVSLCDNEIVFTCKRGKRLNLCDAPGFADADLMNASKRLKISSNIPVEMENSQMKDLPLSVDVEKSFSALGVSKEKGHSTNTEEEDQMDLDLSLHL